MGYELKKSLDWARSFNGTIVAGRAGGSGSRRDSWLEAGLEAVLGAWNIVRDEQSRTNGDSRVVFTGNAELGAETESDCSIETEKGLSSAIWTP